MSLTENAIKVLERRYLSKDENGSLTETPDEMFRRVAAAISKADELYLSKEEVREAENDFYEMMTNLKFLPNSPTLMNAGRPLGQLSACFVLPVEDSMEKIFESIKNAALIHKSGGGTGFSFSRLRGNGATVKSTGGVASGPISFMKVFNSATEAVKQGGTRRGANMGILRVDHPDIREFITCKQDSSDITNFNISIALTSAFMTALENGAEYDIIDPKSKKVVRKESAQDIFDKIIENAWNNGEPGIVFLDRINESNVLKKVGEIESTNPCGEQPLLPYESCNLGSINLLAMLKEADGVYEVDYDKLRDTVRKAVHFLDNVIDVNKYPLQQIDEMTKSTRKIGLGVMGWADMLCMLRIPFDSEEALELANKVMGFIHDEAEQKSTEIAKVKGTFPYYDKSTYADSGLELRNATTTTIAPTGTLSIIAGVSSGIEPLFAISYIRNVMDNDELIEVNPLFADLAKKEGFYSDELMKKIAQKGSINDFEEIPDYIKNIFVTAHDISPAWHVKMQAAFQNHTDKAVSKTVNLHHDATKEDVREVYELAYSTGCKGVTIYRDGSRDSQVLNIGKVNKGEEKCIGQANESAGQEASEGMHTVTPRSRPDVTTGFTEKVKIGCGNLYITVNYDEKGICEVFTNLGRGGGCPSQSEATSRLLSIALRSGIDVKSLVEQLRGIRCTSTIRKQGLTVTSCPDAIGRVIQKVMKISSENGNGQGNGNGNVSLFSREEPAQEDMDNIKTPASASCPECGTPVEHESGCVICRNCGYSKCG
ncbi:MAG: vitamin B12-dependent ribonucleotide reductase [Eubacteriales bacterium]|nr:vitamin B12-dependent ribonucleotide reductase [Eubacteriales bacterium]